MLSLEEKKVFKFLKEKNISDKYIYKIKEIFEEESIKFCIKTMNGFTSEEIRESVMKMKQDDEEDFMKYILSDMKDINPKQVLTQLGY